MKSLVFLSVWFFSVAYAARPPSTEAAEYYFRTQEYTRSLELWTAILDEQPDQLTALLRVGELTLLLQGRASLDELISRRVTPRQKNFSPETSKRLDEELERLQSRFLTDRGQSRYLQSVEHVKLQHCEQAISLLDEVVSLERGNQKALLLKAQCEAELKRWENRFATLKRAFRSNPLDPNIQDQIFEAYAYFGEHARLLEEVNERPVRSLTTRQKTAWAVALWNEHKEAASWRVIREILADPGAAKHPVLYFMAGEHTRTRSPTRAAEYFKTFLSVASDLNATEIQGFDPYRVPRFIPQAQKFFEPKTGA